MNKSFTYKVAATLATVMVMASTTAFGSIPPAHKQTSPETRPAAVNLSRAAIHHRLIAAEASERLSRVRFARLRAHAAYRYDTGNPLPSE